MDERKALYLVDVSSLFFRAFYSVRPLTSPQGVPVNAVYGLVTMIMRLLRETKPDGLIFCFDRPEPSFRVAIDGRYKANREAMPEDLEPQIPYIKKVCEGFGVPCLELAGFEADDLIGTIGTKALGEGWRVVIVSGDKDFGQMVQDGVTLYDTMKEVRYDRQGIFDKMGVWPEQVVDYLALVGDASDNVPGVKGIGAKGAAKLLAEHQSLNGIFENIKQLKSESLRSKLQDGRVDAELSRRLVTIRCDVPISLDLQLAQSPSLKSSEIPAGLRPLLAELGFKSLVKDAPGESAAPAPVKSFELSDTGATAPTAVTVEVSGDVDRIPGSAFARWYQRLHPLWVLTSAQGVAFGQHDGPHARTALIDGGLDRVAQILDHPDTKLAGYDIKSFARSIGLSRFQLEWDHQLAAYVLEAGEVPPFESLLQAHANLQLSALPTPAERLSAHQRLRQALEARLQEGNLESLLMDLDFPLVPLLTRMEIRGVAIDKAQLSAQSAALTKGLQGLESEIHRLAGRPFSVASPKQLAQVLFEDLGLPPSRKTKTGHSTDSDVLESLQSLHPICAKVIEYRELAKLKSTYVDALPLLADSSSRLHTTFNAALTTTGRLSSTQPNLQNIPIRTPRGSAVRRAFVAASGQLLVSADYSQIELRILAHLSEDPGLMRAFAEGLDVHAATAAEIFGVPVGTVTSEQRRQAKAVNFGLAYGQGAFGLATALGISRGAASQIISEYFEKFSRVRDFMQSTVESAQARGYVETIFGRRRYIRELASKNAQVQKAGERAAINAPIQGSAADLVKIAMLSIDRILPGELILQVHDELIVEVPSERAEFAQTAMQSAMESAVQLKVPLVVHCKAGASWEEAHS
jgi:DNA polymerase-1